MSEQKKYEPLTQEELRIYRNLILGSNIKGSAVRAYSKILNKLDDLIEEKKK